MGHLTDSIRSALKSGNIKNLKATTDSSGKTVVVNTKTGKTYNGDSSSSKKQKSTSDNKKSSKKSTKSYSKSTQEIINKIKKEAKQLSKEKEQVSKKTGIESSKIKKTGRGYETNIGGKSIIIATKEGNLTMSKDVISDLTKPVKKGSSVKYVETTYEVSGEDVKLKKPLGAKGVRSEVEEVISTQQPLYSSTTKKLDTRSLNKQIDVLKNEGLITAGEAESLKVLSEEDPNKASAEVSLLKSRVEFSTPELKKRAIEQLSEGKDVYLVSTKGGVVDYIADNEETVQNIIKKKASKNEESQTLSKRDEELLSMYHGKNMNVVERELGLKKGSLDVIAPIAGPVMGGVVEFGKPMANLAIPFIRAGQVASKPAQNITKGNPVESIGSTIGAFGLTLGKEFGVPLAYIGKSIGLPVNPTDVEKSFDRSIKQVGADYNVPKVRYEKSFVDTLFGNKESQEFYKKAPPWASAVNIAGEVALLVPAAPSAIKGVSKVTSVAKSRIAQRNVPTIEKYILPIEKKRPTPSIRTIKPSTIKSTVETKPISIEQYIKPPVPTQRRGIGFIDEMIYGLKQKRVDIKSVKTAIDYEASRPTNIKESIGTVKSGLSKPKTLAKEVSYEIKARKIGRSPIVTEEIVKEGYGLTDPTIDRLVKGLTRSTPKVLKGTKSAGKSKAAVTRLDDIIEGKRPRNVKNPRPRRVVDDVDDLLGIDNEKGAGTRGSKITRGRSESTSTTTGKGRSNLVQRERIKRSIKGEKDTDIKPSGRGRQRLLQKRRTEKVVASRMQEDVYIPLRVPPIVKDNKYMLYKSPLITLQRVSQLPVGYEHVGYTDMPGIKLLDVPTNVKLLNIPTRTRRYTRTTPTDKPTDNVTTTPKRNRSTGNTTKQTTDMIQLGSPSQPPIQTTSKVEPYRPFNFLDDRSNISLTLPLRPYEGIGRSSKRKKNAWLYTINRYVGKIL